MSEVGFEPTQGEHTATWTQRLRPLGHPDILRQMLQYFTLLITINYCVKWKGKMSEVGFELTPGETCCDLNAAP